MNKPIPDDLVPILAKDEEKQKQIREKASKDASTSGARTIGINSVLNPTPNNNRPVIVTNQSKPVAAKVVDKETAKPSVAKPADAIRKGGIKLAAIPPHKSTVAAAAAAAAAAPAKPVASDAAKAAKPAIAMSIQVIPPFRGSKPNGPSNGPSGNGNANGSGSSATTPMPTSPTTAARLNVNASSFRPNPKASAFSPVINARFLISGYINIFFFVGYSNSKRSFSHLSQA